MSDEASYQRMISTGLAFMGIPFVDRIASDEATIRDYLNLELRTLWIKEWWAWIIDDVLRTFTNSQLDLSILPLVRDIQGVFKDGPEDVELICRDKVRSQLLGRTLQVYSNSTLPDDLFVRSRRPVPVYEGTEYSLATNYIIGDKVFFTPGSGLLKTREVWVALVDNINSQPDDSNTDWEQLQVPVEFEQFLTHATANDFLLGEGQAQKHLATKVNPEDALFDLYDLLERSQGENEFRVTPVSPAHSN